MGDNVEYHTGEQFRISLVRPDTSVPWGFRLQGGVDFNTHLSIQSVQPNSVAEKAGLQAGDGILLINNTNSDTLSHDQAKQEIVRSANNIQMVIQRGAVKLWKPQVTPLSQLRPAELKTIKTATGEDLQPVQKTSLAINKPYEEPLHIGSSHNRSAQPFGAAKQATPKIVHAQYNSPMGLYSADNIADTYATQTVGITKELTGMDIRDLPVGTKVSGTYQTLQQEETAQGHDLGAGFGGPPGFRSIQAPQAKPPGERQQQQPSMRCGGCDMLATGVIVRAGGVPYHVGCFKCASCGINLKQKGYFLVNEKLYCETHARRVAQPPNPDMVAVPVYR